MFPDLFGEGGFASQLFQKALVLGGNILLALVAVAAVVLVLVACHGYRQNRRQIPAKLA